MDDNFSNGFEKIQDVLGQLTSLKLYMHMALGFSVKGKDIDAVLQDLYRAAKQLVRALPFLTGHVIRRGSGPGKTGLATIVPYPAGQTREVFILEDCQHLCPPMATILAAGAPMEMLDGDILTRRTATTHSYDDSAAPAPVLEIQANIVQGGVILVFQGHHNTMDMNGMAQIIQLYAKALRNEAFTDVEVERGNQDRRNMVKLLEPSQLSDLSRYMPVAKVVASTSSSQTLSLPPSDLRWVYFHFPAERLAELKKVASMPFTGGERHLHSGSVLWITTDDALSAFLCQRILIARMKRLPKTSTNATLCRAINARRFLDPPLPKEYMGHAVTGAQTNVSLDDTHAAALVNDLSGLAHQMRSDVLAVKSHEIQSFATKLDSLDDKGGLSFGARLDPAAFDIILSSWSGLEVGTTEFGRVLGQPAFVKRPRLPPVESLIYLMPKSPDAHVDVACCLQGQDIESLRADAEFNKYGLYIG